MAGERPLTYFVARLYRSNQDALLAAVSGLAEDRFRWRPARSNSIAFNVWHLARWSDHLQSILPDMTPALRERLGSRPEIWHRDGLVRRWAFPTSLGHVETGMGMDEEASARLPLPATDELLGYARAAFGAAQQAVEALREDDYLQPAAVDLARATWLSGPDQTGQVIGWVLTYARHDARHLGMIEALKGAQGERGTATV